ncbi:MAG: DEAD/DEAH box helicase [Desulfovibrionaceae bacterium]|nr:DEAD/DEAH box helicase [Desulfovibrionaceae bacterium]
MDVFSRFAPFIQDFIYLNNWSSLRPVQIAAAEVIFTTDQNLLLAASTASGKTEAAFFPILTLLSEDPPQSIGALYIGPLKALINDQFHRLDDLCLDAGIPVSRWHGDVGQYRKDKLLKYPRGILQITPESLEAMLMRRFSLIPKLFCDLRFIVIDEVHSLLRGERGGQTLCCLERLSRIAKVKPRRVGLSATIGDPTATGDYLARGSGHTTAIRNIQSATASWRLSVENFPLIDEPPTKPGATSIPAFDDPGLHFVFTHTAGKKCLVFVNSREECEVVTTRLRQICEERKEADRFLIHHGNLSTSYREMAEEAMRNPKETRSTVTTSTLELGIDIGRLERVFQLDAPFSVASFLQRLGRTGRRGNPPEMCFVIREKPWSAEATLPEVLPWKLMQSVALIQLYREERWVEPPRLNKVPYSLLYHQTLSTITSEGELSPPMLAGRILTLASFQSVSQDDFRTLLRHMLETEILTRTDRGGLILGPKGEIQTSSYKFYAVFKENEEYTVRDAHQELGTIVNPPPVGDKIAIAGHVWLVEDIDYKRHLIHCSLVPGNVSPYFGLCPGDIHTRILERMRTVLEEDTDYPYLMPQARERLKEARDIACATGLRNTPLVSLGEDRYCLFPWLGTYAFLALERFLKKICAKKMGLSAFEVSRPYCILFRMESDPTTFLKSLHREASVDFPPMSLLSPTENPLFEKYDSFLPIALVRKGFAFETLDRAGMRRRIAEWVR